MLTNSSKGRVALKRRAGTYTQTVSSEAHAWFVYHDVLLTVLSEKEKKPTIIMEETRPGASNKSEDGCLIFQPLNQDEVDILHTPTPSGTT